MEKFDVIIIGAGAAGLFAAISCYKPGLTIGLLEKNSSGGKKLLVSGSGRCNITHDGDVSDFILHFGERKRFVKPAIYNFSNNDLMDFFHKRNLPLVELYNGKIFPETEKSSDVLKVFLEECNKKKVKINYNSPVKKLSYDNGFFSIDTNEKRFQSRYLIIATGGKSYPTTGSTGDGYTFAENLGHSVTELRPALTPLLVRDYHYGSCSGISIKGAEVSLYRGGKKINSASGDLLFTHRGLSGPVILDFSRFILPGDEIKISLVKKNYEEFNKILLEDIKKWGKKTIKSYLNSFDISERLVIKTLEKQAIDPAMKLSVITKDIRKALVKVFTELSFSIARVGDYKEAMVTAGGVSCDEVNPRTMESKIIEGLYFSGEVLDVDGDTGGYNLQFAFSSAVLASQNILKKI